MRLEVQVLLLVLSTVESFVDRFTYDFEDSEIDSNEVDGKCRCVQWHLCNEMGYIITDGSEALLTPRMLFSPTCEECGECPSAHICCKEPPDLEEPFWGACGINKYNTLLMEPRVMNVDRRIGQTKFAEFPWTLMLFKAKRNSDCEWQKYVFKGGASLIHPRIALTTAHLVLGANKSMITVRAGEWNASSDTEDIPHQNRGVQNIIIHPAFDKVHLHNDIALLILDTPFEITENVAPICLPFPDVKYDRNNCLAAGWGTNRFGPEGRYATTQRKVHLPIVSHEQCEKKLKKSNLGEKFRLHNSFICAGGKPEQDTCLGDGGGPLMCPTEDGAYVQIGIVSWGIKCGTEYPAVYTDVAKLLTWILNNTGGDLERN